MESATQPFRCCAFKEAFLPINVSSYIQPSSSRESEKVRHCHFLTSCKPSRATLLAHLAHAAVPALGPVPLAAPLEPPPPPLPPPSPGRLPPPTHAPCPKPGSFMFERPPERLDGDPGETNVISAATSRRLASCRAARNELRREERVRRARESAPVTSPFLSNR